MASAAGDASSFETAEHIWLSNKAVCLVLARRGPPPPSKCSDNTVDGVLQCLAYEEDATSYGEVAAYADFVSRADFLIDENGSGVKRLDAREVKRGFDEGYWHITEMLRNGHHFREAAMRGYQRGHELAIRTAASRVGDMSALVEALAYNAYADHFLEDFFAPGHMTEEAIGVTHMANARAHDRDNQQGRKFRLDADAWKRLADDVFGPGSLTLKAGEEGGLSKYLDCFADDKAILYKALTELSEASLNSKAVNFVGDGDIVQDERVLPGQQQQVLLIVMAVASSILDVVQASEGNDRTGGRCPTPAREAEGQSSAGPLSPLCTCPKGSNCYSLTKETKNSVDDSGVIASIPLGTYLSTNSLWDAISWPIIGMSAELQTSNSDSRMVASPELIWPLHRFSENPWVPAAQLGVGVSYVGRTSGSYHGLGPDLRLHLHWKDFGVMAEGDVGYRYYYGFGDSSDNPRGGIRLGFGNGLVWGYVSYSIDKRLTSDSGAKWDYATWGLGVSINFSSAYVARTLRQCLRCAPEPVDPSSEHHSTSE